MASIKVAESSAWPEVIRIKAELASKGRQLEYAVVDNITGRLISYKPVGELLIIAIPPKATVPAITSGNLVSVMNTDFFNREIDRFAQMPQSNNRLLYFGLGLAVLTMLVVYSRKGAK